MVQRNIFTIITPLDSDEEKLASLQKLLNHAGDDLMNDPIVNFRQSPPDVHFLRWVVLPPGKDAQRKEITPSLVYSVCCDGALLPHLQALVAQFRTSLDHIYNFSLYYPLSGSNEDVVRYLESYAVSYAAGYCGTPFRDLIQIRQEDRLYNFLQESIDKYRPDWQMSTPAAKIKAELEEAVRQNSLSSLEPILNWLQKAQAQTSLFWWVILILVLFSLTLVAGLGYWAYLGPEWVTYSLTGLFLFSLGFVGWVILSLRWQERTDAQAMHKNLPKLYEALGRREDRNIAVQNQMTHLVNIKPGWVRQLCLRGFLFVINVLAKYVYNQGKLGDIPTIHFAHWVIIDGGRRLLFFSNFDGSWESYLGDFIDKASYGLTGIWSNTVGFPKTSWLILEGATNESLFKNWTRNHQIETQFWYSTYPLLTVRNINRSSNIRFGLTQKTTPENAARWLRLFN